MPVHSYKENYVDIPKWLQFSEMSVLRCERQSGEMTGIGRRSAQISGAGSDLLVCGHEPLLGKVQHAAAMVTAHPLPSRWLVLFCVLWEMQRQDTKWVFSFLNPCPWVQSKASLCRHLTVLLPPGQDWVKLILAQKHLRSKDQAIKKKFVIHVILK